MPTIKRKVEMNLPQLIEWGWKNKELSKNKRFTSKNKGNLTIKQSVIFNYFSYAEIECNYCYGPEDIFTVEIEEPITEDTEIKGLVEFGNNGYGTDFFQCNGLSINEQKDFDSEAFYIMNDDLTMTLIWKNGKMVE